MVKNREGYFRDPAWDDGIFLSLDAKELALVFSMVFPSLPSPNPLQTTWVTYFFFYGVLKVKVT